jgi:hypothetical protein
MADSKLYVQTADDVAPITAQCAALGKASDGAKMNNLFVLTEQHSLIAKLAARKVQEGIGHRDASQAMLDGGAVDGAAGGPAKKAKTEDSEDWKSMYNDLLLKFQVVLEFVVKFQQVPGAGAYFQPGVAPPIVLDSAEINFTKGRASRRAPHCSFSHRFSSTTSRRTTARARRRPARTRSLKRVATPPPSHMCARRL